MLPTMQMIMLRFLILTGLLSLMLLMVQEGIALTRSAGDVHVCVLHSQFCSYVRARQQSEKYNY